MHSWALKSRGYSYMHSKVSSGWSKLYGRKGYAVKKFGANMEFEKIGMTKMAKLHMLMQTWALKGRNNKKLRKSYMWWYSKYQTLA